MKDRTLTIERIFNAPINLVWEAWSDPTHIAKWWGPPGMEVIIKEHSFEIGGTWRYDMSMPNGGLFTSEGQYLSITPLKKIITTANFRPMTEGVELHLTFRADGDRTHFTLACVHPTAEYARKQEEMGFYNGWGSTVDRLALTLEK